MTIEEGKTYTPADPEWAAVVSELREGDEVEYWHSHDSTPKGVRGALEPHVGGLRAPGTVVNVSGAAVTELTVTKLAPREPSWAGARVVLGGHRNEFTLGPRGRYYRPYRSPGLRPEQVDGPVTVLLDAEGRIPVDSVLAVNGVTRAELFNVIREHLCPYLTHSERLSLMESILTALGGAR